MHSVPAICNTGLPAYSDGVGTAKNVTVTGVTVSGEACIEISPICIKCMAQYGHTVHVHCTEQYACYSIMGQVISHGYFFFASWLRQRIRIQH